MNKEIIMDPIWYKDIEILIKHANEFVPLKDHSIEEKLNAVMRGSIYLSILLYMYYNDTQYFYIAIVAGLLTFFIYSQYPKTDKELKSILVSTPSPINLEKFEKDQCTMPTIDNPFMNATMKDYMNIDAEGKIVDRPPACDVEEPEVKKQIDDYFNNNLYRDVDDVFGKMNSQRQFFTMPWTTIPNDPNLDFAKWLYLNPKTCKEDQDYCIKYEDVRQNRLIFPDPTQNPISTKKNE
jgi:hypothetical protein